MPFPLRFLAAPPLLASLLLVLGLTAGCSSDRHPDRSAAHRPPLVPLTGQGAFFNGQLLAQINVGGSTRAEALAESGVGNSDSDRDNRGERRGRRGGGMAGGERREGDSEGLAHTTRARLAPTGPLVMIHLRFTNLGPAPMEVHIHDFVSLLGNFAVQPDKLMLAPGQSLETEPMSSPVNGAFAEIEVRLTLRVGQKTENQFIALRPVSRPASAP